MRSLRLDKSAPLSLITLARELINDGMAIVVPESYADELSTCGFMRTSASSASLCAKAFSLNPVASSATHSNARTADILLIV